MEWLNAVALSVWQDLGELPDSLSKWITYTDTVQVMCEMEMYQVGAR
jgi:hypothetical protein